MPARPPLPEGTELQSAINGWVHDPESGMNGHVWYGAGRSRALGVFSSGLSNRVYARVQDERVRGFNRDEIVASAEYDPADDVEERKAIKRACVGEVLEDAIDWMQATAPSEWSHPRVDETIFEAPVGYELARVYVENRETTVYYERTDYEAELSTAQRSNPREFARSHRPYLYVHEWAGSGNTTVAVAPWMNAHGVGTRHEEIAPIVETPDNGGLDVAISMARQWAREQIDAETETTTGSQAQGQRPTVGQTNLGQFVGVSTDGGVDRREDRDESGHADEEDSHGDGSPRVLTLVSCAASKQDLAEGETVPARELYDSAVHTCKDRYARHSHAYYIASAKFGLVHHDEDLPEYDQRLSDRTEDEQMQWARDLLADLADAVDRHDVDAVVFLGGREYVAPLLALVDESPLAAPIYTPWQSLDEITGVGKGMAWSNTEAHWPENLSSLDPTVLGEPRTSAE
jgi:hypothetical protein